MKLKNEEEEKIEQVKRADNLAEQVNKALGEKFQLQREVEQLKKDLDALLSRTHCTEDEVEQLKKDKQWLEHSRLEWARRALERGKKLYEAEKEIEQLKNRLDKVNSDRTELQKDRDVWVRNNCEKQAEIAELKNRLDKANADRTALQKNLDYYMDVYKKVQDDYDELHKKYSECQGTVDKQAEQIRNLKAKQDSVRKNCYDQGQTDLWDMLQNVNDAQPNEFDVECNGMEDVIDMDLEDFLGVITIICISGLAKQILSIFVCSIRRTML